MPFCSATQKATSTPSPSQYVHQAQYTQTTDSSTTQEKYTKTASYQAQMPNLTSVIAP